MKGRKALLFSLGVLTVVASMAMAQAAFANHETVTSALSTTGSVVPSYKQCGTYDSTAGTAGTGENWGTLPGDNPGAAAQHAAPVAFASCQVGASGAPPNPGGLSDKSKLLTPHAFTSSYTVKVVHPSPADNTTTAEVEGWGPNDKVDVVTTSTSNGTFCENPANFAGGASNPLALSECGDIVNNSTGASGTGCAPNPPTACDGIADSGPQKYGGTSCAAGAVCNAWLHGKYNGVALGESRVRTTDAENCAAPCDTGTLHATVKDFNFTVKIACVAGKCNSKTTADAQFGPTFVANSDPTIVGKLGDVELFSILVKDPGADGSAGTGCPLQCGTGDENIAARTGLFIN